MSDEKVTAKSPSRMEMEREGLFRALDRFKQLANQCHVSSGEICAVYDEILTMFDAARERPDEVVVARGEYSDKTGDVLVGGFVECRILLTAPNADKMTKFDGQHVAVVVVRNGE